MFCFDGKFRRWGFYLFRFIGGKIGGAVCFALGVTVVWELGGF